MLKPYRSIQLALVVAAATLGNLAAARGELIVQRPLGVDRNPNIYTTSDFHLEVSLFGNSFSAPLNLIKLVDANISPADGSRVFSLTEGTLYDDLVARLTDGVDEFIQVKLTEIASNRSERRGFRESGFFRGFTSLAGPDLAGARVEGVELRIDHFNLAFGSPASLAVSLPPVDLAMTFTVRGSVIPEPGSLALAGIGLAAATAAAYTRRHRRRVT